MYFLNLSTFALGISLSFAKPTSRNYVPHEKRTASPSWIKLRRAVPETKLPVRIALAQQNLHLGHDLLMQVSDPTSEKYGQYMSSKEVGDLFRPSAESINKVRGWLHDAGIVFERHEVSAGRGWLRFNASVNEVESLLATEYHIFHHSPTEEEHIGCSEYHIPQHIQEHIEFITPTVSLSKINSGSKKKKKRMDKDRFKGASNLQVARAVEDARHAGSEVPCYTAVTIDCIRRIYLPV